MKCASAACVIAGVLALASPAAAHDTWIVPRRAVVPGRLVMFVVTSGAAFPAVEYGPRADRVADGGWRVGTLAGPFTGRAADDSTLTLAVVPRGEGTAVAWVAFHPGDIDLDNDDVTHYLDEIGAGNDVRAEWEAAGPDRAWHEVYTKYAKTFVRTGGVGDDASCLQPVGLELELVPDRDPTGIAAGDTLTIRVLEAGEGLPGIAVGAVSGFDGTHTLERTNAAGYVRVAITSAGPWLIRATDLDHRSDGTWESAFTTMTFVAGTRRP
jgi:uncharacterized GH25 family protein